MPPFVPRKRQRSTSPVATSPTSSKPPIQKRAKPTLFDALDALPRQQKDIEQSKQQLEELNNADQASSSEADSDEFEDIPPGKRRMPIRAEEENEDTEDDEDALEWEDAIHQTVPSTKSDHMDPEIGDVTLSMKEDGSFVDPGVSVPGLSKKGPSKRERFIRFQTHCVHVQALLWHNTIRNSWLNDKELQQTLVEQLPDGVKREIDRWKAAMGISSKEELKERKQATASKSERRKRERKPKNCTGRDWNCEAEHAEQGVLNLSTGDPLFRLLKVITAYWRKRFTITAPGLRKQGYLPLNILRDKIKHWENNKDDLSHGERIENIEHFRKLAHNCEGSRDVGAQLFAALLRGIGIETRLVANIQPSGFGWSKSEEANVEVAKSRVSCNGLGTDAPTELVNKTCYRTDLPVASKQINGAKEFQRALNTEKPVRASPRTSETEVIQLDSDSPLSSAPTDTEEPDDDDLLILESTSMVLKKKKQGKNFDKDLPFPNYWVEICSPASNKIIPVDPIVLSTIASNEELLQTFEPRGKKAENAKQVICYTVAFSSDGTAKDVTLRYLKKHRLPGKTKGVRMPVEKIPLYDCKGKVKKYEEYDWFRTVMSLYDRPESKRTVADDLEENTVLKPFHPAKEEKEVEKESLQWYKQSADFVLEQHLRREEAILPDAQPVKTFTAGKGEKAKEHLVFRRQDVVTCKTVESWHKEGREIKVGEQPIKQVPVRAVTLIRKREMEEWQRETGEKLKQGLYSIDQTEWIVPPPIKNGIIPKNAFGNMDVYVPTMVPKGAVHIPLKGTAKICRKLEIDYAEACTGFEFGKQRAVPVLTGVVVAAENEALVRDAWRTEQEEIKRKEDIKRTGMALHWWRKMLLGLRVIEHMRVEYQGIGGTEENSNPFVKKATREDRTKAAKIELADEQGDGFFLQGHDQVLLHTESENDTEDAESDEVNMNGGGFIIEEGIDDSGKVENKGYFLVDDLEKQGKDGLPITITRSPQPLHQAMGGTNDGVDVNEVTRRQSSKSKARVKDDIEICREMSGESASFDPTGTLSREGSERESHSVLSAKPKDVRRLPRVVTKHTGSLKLMRRNTSVDKKATPIKSQYFEPNGDAEEDEEEMFSDHEIVKPRQTTARTKAKKALKCHSGEFHGH
ncbi:hypothetical protein M433DRAFT_261475 [Acidomyces richmondensis BFW]|nr:MAG: hypothetical protein FE78DRAFT_32725 [Acidomyces sp. 'richmondensis']KYG49746.1 hypothetical protein M433DRAFT_261475 [Acidomyces richmondensis BFW]